MVLAWFLLSSLFGLGNLINFLGFTLLSHLYASHSPHSCMPVSSFMSHRYGLKSLLFSLSSSTFPPPTSPSLASCLVNCQTLQNTWPSASVSLSIRLLPLPLFLPLLYLHIHSFLDHCHYHWVVILAFCCFVVNMMCRVPYSLFPSCFLSCAAFLSPDYCNTWIFLSACILSLGVSWPFVSFVCVSFALIAFCSLSCIKPISGVRKY